MFDPSGGAATCRRSAAGASLAALTVVAGLLSACSGTAGTAGTAGTTSAATVPSSTAAGKGSATGSSSAATPPSTPARPGRTSSTSPARSGTASSGTPRCHTEGLRITMVRRTFPSPPGTRTALLAMQNMTDHACTVLGYPGLALVDTRGNRLPTTLERSPGAVGGSSRPSKKLVALSGGETAWTVVAWLRQDPGDAGATVTCDKRAVGTVVTPPDETTHVTVTFPFTQTCNRGYTVVQPFAGPQLP